MDITKLATQILASTLNNSSSNNTNDTDLIQSVIGNLLGNSQSSGIDLSSIVDGLQNGGLGDIVGSWLGDGDNAQISPAQIENIFGSDKIAEAAKMLGADQNDLLRGLQDMLPQVIDKSSSGGSLLDSVGGISGLANLASKFLK